MRMKSFDGAPKVERKTVEKNRRMQMKKLLFKLSSLIPKDYSLSKDTLSQQDYLDQTATYIKRMNENIDKLKQRKAIGTGDQMNNQKTISGLKLPMVEVRRRDSSLEVLLINRQSKASIFHEVISVMEEEGAEVINASSSVAGDKIFHTIHCQELCSTVGLNTSVLYERIKELIA